jgi:hypothetical protein
MDKNYILCFFCKKAVLADRIAFLETAVNNEIVCGSCMKSKYPKHIYKIAKDVIDKKTQN